MTLLVKADGMPGPDGTDGPVNDGSKLRQRQRGILEKKQGDDGLTVGEGK